MSSFEMNKIFAAVLVAGIAAMFSGFIADHIVHPHAPAEDAVFVEGAPVEAGGPVAPQLPEPVLHLVAEADPARGEKLSRACAACHSFEKGGPVKTGPPLWDVVGGPRAAKDFAYSEGMEEMGGRWSYTDLNKFLWKPKKFIEDTKMNYIGLKKPEDRAAMIAWLRTLDGSPAPLPSQAQIEAEKAELAPPEDTEPEAGEAEASESEQ